MNPKNWLPQIIIFSLLVILFAANLSYSDFISEMSISVIGILDASLAIKFYRPHSDKLTRLLVLYMASTAFRFIVFGIWIYFKGIGETDITEPFIRAVTVVPMSVSRILLYFYVNEKT